MKDSSSTNLVYIKNVDINKIKSIISLIIFKFRKWFDNFIIKIKIYDFRTQNIILY